MTGPAEEIYHGDLSLEFLAHLTVTARPSEPEPVADACRACRPTCSPRSSARSPSARRGRRRHHQPGHRRPRPPTPAAHRRGACSKASRDPRTHQYPTNQGTAEFRDAVAGLLCDAVSASRSTRRREIVPLLGAKEGIAHICLALLDPGDVCLAADPGYPVYTTGPMLADGTAVHLPLRARAAAFSPTSTTSSRRRSPGPR